MKPRRSLAAALALPLLLGALMLASRSRAGEGDRASGFDHLDHTTKVAVSGTADLPCSACHTLDRRGRAQGRYDHRTCLQGCHGGRLDARSGRPVARAESARPVCLVCHAPEIVDAMAAGTWRRGTAQRPSSDPEHAIAMPHARHKGEPCKSCHFEGAATPRPHDRCTGCHGGSNPKTPAMGACAGCHVAQVGQPGPAIERGLLSTAARFDHRSAAHRGAPCTRCHTAIATEKGDRLAPPPKKSCEGCHDGQQAFSVVRACTRCHSAPSRPVFFERRSARFRHGDHPQDCRACHTLDDRGLPEMAASIHELCAKCHRPQFSSLEPSICATCHAGVEPWRRLHVEPWSHGASFETRFDHRSHPEVPGACASCHAQSTGRAQRTGHARCSGGICHATGAGPAPWLASCDGCHQRVEREQTGDRRRWSVAARFDHGPHRRDPRTAKPLACESCHGDISRRSAPPPKSTCTPCHDGRTAFKVTGHGCRRCHL